MPKSSPSKKKKESRKTVAAKTLPARHSKSRTSRHSRPSPPSRALVAAAASETEDEAFWNLPEDRVEPPIANESLQAVNMPSTDRLLPEIVRQPDLLKLRNDAALYLYTIDAFPLRMEPLNKHVAAVVAPILGLGDGEGYYVGAATIQEYLSTISTKRSTFCDYVKRFITGYDFHQGNQARSSYIGTLLKKGIFSRKNFDKHEALFSGRAFLDCLYQCVCRSHGSKQKILGHQLTRSTLALVFVVMLLKLKIASGDTTVTQFKKSDENDYYKLYKELLDPIPKTVLAKSIDWEQGLGYAKEHLNSMESSTTNNEQSSLNDLFEGTDSDEE